MNFDHFLKLCLTVSLAVIGFFLMQTFLAIKNLEKDIITIREKISAFEATRMTRKDIMEMISDYHENHPHYINFKRKKEHIHEKNPTPDTAGDTSLHRHRRFTGMRSQYQCAGLRRRNPAGRCRIRFFPLHQG